MMKRIIGYLLSIVIIFSISTVFAQQDDEPVLLTISGDKVTLSEFENIYKKNNNVSNTVDKKSLDEYLDLFINFKLKVKEAEDLGLDTTKEFIKELGGYRKQLAKPYLVDKDVNEYLVKEAYERMQWDVKASHILIRVKKDAASKDTLIAYNKIMNTRRSIVKGEDFANLAKEVSEDPSAKDNGGNLGYFTAFYMVYPFETAAYSTKVGEVSMPVRTQFGYHIISVADKRKARGEIRTAHIMVKTSKTNTEVQNEEAKKKADEIYEKLKSGEDFAELVKTSSDDKGSIKKGGELPWFGTGRMVGEFEDAAFALKNDGDFSEPVQTKYGWHIIKRLEYKPLKAFSELQTELKNKVAKDPRAARSTTSLLKKIKKDYGYRPILRERDDFFRIVDTSYSNGNWSVERAKTLTKTIFTLSEKQYSNKTQKYTQQDFANYLAKKMKKRKKQNLRELVKQLYITYVDESCMDFEESILEHKYPEFKALMQEYRDGILLFELMDDKVWSRAVKDTSGLEAYYQQNKMNFMWDERLDATIFTCSNADIAKSARKLVQKQIKKGYSDQYILDKLNTETEQNLTIKAGKFIKNDNEIIKKTNWELGISPNWEIEEKTVFVHAKKILKPEPKTLLEARGLVTAAYQTFLEKEWLTDLKSKYKVEVNKEVFSKIK